MEADPAPASFENAALLNPTRSTPITPPTPIACGLNASVKIKASALSTNEKLERIIYKHANKYKTAINGTTFSVTEAILFIPPIIITPTNSARITPITKPALVLELSKPKSSFKTIVA